MKLFVLVLLMMILPAQATLAAVENTHGHTFALEHHEKTVALTAENEHHDPCVDQHKEHSNSPSHCEQGHHHCHAGNLGVLPNVTSFHVDASVWRQAADTQTQFQSFLDTRIERPKWA
jgi:hypothetical protein